MRKEQKVDHTPASAAASQSSQGSSLIVRLFDFEEIAECKLRNYKSY
jgi:hypothetical protein